MKLVHCICLLSVLLSSCQPRFLDLSSDQNKLTVITPTEKGFYSSPTWVSEALIIFNYGVSENASFTKGAMPDLHFYNIEKGTWGKIPTQPDQTCNRLYFNYLQRLPNQHLGFMYSCMFQNNTDRTENIIQEMDTANGKITTLADSGTLSDAGHFSFSPEMSEFVEENNVGAALTNTLYYRKGNNSIQIVPDFVRAMTPAWSPYNREIVFWGTKDYQGIKPTEFKSMSDISGLVLYPWDLYVSAPEGANLKKLLSAVSDPSFIKWSPTENRFAFSGTIDNVPGIWLLDRETSTLIRIWQKRSSFDWSPDGSKLVILDQEKDQDEKVISQNINIVTLSLK